MTIKDFQCIRDSTLATVYCRTHHGWGRTNIFEIKALRWQENGILKLLFANIVCHKSTILLIFEAEFIVC